MLWPGEGLISLNIQINIGSSGIGNLVDTLGAAAVLGRGHARMPAVFLAHFQDFLGIRRHHNSVKQRRRGHATVDVANHGKAGDLSKRFARKAG